MGHQGTDLAGGQVQDHVGRPGGGDQDDLLAIWREDSLFQDRDPEVKGADPGHLAVRTQLQDEDLVGQTLGHLVPIVALVAQERPTVR